MLRPQAGSAPALGGPIQPRGLTPLGLRLRSLTRVRLPEPLVRLIGRSARSVRPLLSPIERMVRFTESVLGSGRGSVSLAGSALGLGPVLSASPGQGAGGCRPRRPPVRPGVRPNCVGA